VLDYHLVKGLVVTIVDECLGGLFIEGSGFFHQAQECFAAIYQVIQMMLCLCGAEGVNVKRNAFSV